MENQGNSEALVQKQQDQIAPQAQTFLLTTPVEVNNQIEPQAQEKAINHNVNPEEVQHNYLKIISDTTLDEEKQNETGYHLKPGEKSDSVYGEDNNSDVMD